jgi:hypothetical protein
MRLWLPVGATDPHKRPGARRSCRRFSFPTASCVRFTLHGLLESTTTTGASLGKSLTRVSSMNRRTLCGTAILLFDPHDVARYVNIGAFLCLRFNACQNA